MTDFYTMLDDYLGDADDVTDIRAVVRRLWFYDFDGSPVRIWQGKGKLFTEDGHEWLGSIDASDVDHHETSALQDGRDGSSATYTFGLTIPDLPGEPAFETFEQLKAEQFRVSKRKLTCYLAIFQEGEALRPATPCIFFKELIMIQPKFSEKIESNGTTLIRKYKVSLTAKDANFGRSNTPKGTYADAIQKQRAKELGVSLDRGSEFLAALANRTYTIP